MRGQLKTIFFLLVWLFVGGAFCACAVIYVLRGEYLPAVLCAAFGLGGVSQLVTLLKGLLRQGKEGENEDHHN